MVKVTKLNIGNRGKDFVPDVLLGKNYSIYVPQKLLDNPKYNKFINESSVGALDNYACHNKLRLRIAPLENDLFDDLRVTVSDRYFAQREFAMKVEQGRHAFGDFFKELYKNVAAAAKDLRGQGVKG